MLNHAYHWCLQVGAVLFHGVALILARVGHWPPMVYLGHLCVMLGWLMLGVALLEGLPFLLGLYFRRAAPTLEFVGSMVAMVWSLGFWFLGFLNPWAGQPVVQNLALAFALLGAASFHAQTYQQFAVFSPPEAA